MNQETMLVSFIYMNGEIVSREIILGVEPIITIEPVTLEENDIGLRVVSSLLYEDELPKILSTVLKALEEGVYEPND